MPRHPPCALHSFLTNTQQKQQTNPPPNRNHQTKANRPQSSSHNHQADQPTAVRLSSCRATKLSYKDARVHYPTIKPTTHTPHRGPPHTRRTHERGAPPTGYDGWRDKPAKSTNQTTRPGRTQEGTQEAPPPTTSPPHNREQPRRQVRVIPQGPTVCRNQTRGPNRSRFHDHPPTGQVPRTGGNPTDRTTPRTAWSVLRNAKPPSQRSSTIPPMNTTPPC